MIDDIILLTEKLIRFPSMHANPKEILRCADFIEEYFNEIGVACLRLDHGGVPSVAVLPEVGFAKILLMSHIDVVDAPEDLFSPLIRDGKLYGRGSLDDKYAVALSMVLVKTHLDRLRENGRDIADLPFGILITGDEEVGGRGGAKQALKEIRTEFCIALDGGTVDKIVVKEKGILQLKLISTGRAAHGSRPWLGENAIEKLIDDVGRIKAFFSDTVPDTWQKTINFSMVQAGKSFNQVPDRAEAVFDIRYTDGEDPRELVHRIEEKVQGELVVKALEPIFFGGDSPYLDLLLEVSPESRTGFEHGASDARFLSDYGIPGVVWGADGDRSAHAVDEHVDIDSIARLANILTAFFDRIGNR